LYRLADYLEGLRLAAFAGIEAEQFCAALSSRQVRSLEMTAQ
jgi:hypothetical protein